MESSWGQFGSETEILLCYAHAADSVFSFEAALLDRFFVSACVSRCVFFSSAAFGRREAPGRRLAGGCLGGAFGAPLEGAFGAALPPNRRRLASSNGL